MIITRTSSYKIFLVLNAFDSFQEHPSLLHGCRSFQQPGEPKLTQPTNHPAAAPCAVPASCSRRHYVDSKIPDPWIIHNKNNPSVTNVVTNWIVPDTWYLTSQLLQQCSPLPSMILRQFHLHFSQLPQPLPLSHFHWNSALSYSYSNQDYVYP